MSSRFEVLQAQRSPIHEWPRRLAHPGGSQRLADAPGAPVAPVMPLPGTVAVRALPLCRPEMGRQRLNTRPRSHDGIPAFIHITI